LGKNLKVYSYKIQIVQELKPNDYTSRLKFVLEIARVRNLTNDLFSDEAHFNLHGVVNTQNGITWAKDNPRLSIKTTFDPAEVNDWVGLAAWGLVGPFFFEDHKGNTVTIKTVRYDRKLTNELIAALKKQKGANYLT
jgi:hypothetical protein